MRSTHRARSIATISALTALALTIVAPPAHAGGGELDPSFSGDGKQIVSTGVDMYAQEVLVSSSGKIVLVGYRSGQDFAIVRLTSTGAYDTTFGGGDGIVYTGFGSDSDRAFAATLDPYGRIIVAGSWDDSNFGYDADFAIARYTSAGNLDTTFDGDGKVSAGFGDDDVARDIALQPNGKIVVVGTRGQGTTGNRLAIARLNSNGSADTTFDGDGKLTLSTSGSTGNAVSIQTDGKIVVAGRRWISSAGGFPYGLVVRYHTNGTLDTSFSGDGILAWNMASDRAELTSVTVLASGKILVGGTGVGLEVHRLTSTGSFDSSFGDGGRARFSYGSLAQGRAMVVMPGGKILIAGRIYAPGPKLVVVRFQSNGMIDSTFGSPGLAGWAMFDFGDGATDIALQPDAKVVASATVNQRFAAARLITDVTAPAAPSVALGDGHVLSTWSADRTVRVTWTASDADSGVDGFSWTWTQSATTTTDLVKDAAAGTTSTTSPSLGDGSWWFHIRARDKAGFWSTTRHFGPFYIDATAPSTAVVNPLPLFTVATSYATSWTATDATSGIKNYSAGRYVARYDGDFGATTWGSRTTSTSLTHSGLLGGYTRCHRVRAYDRADNYRTSTATCTATPVDDSVLAATGSWTRESSLPDEYRGTRSSTSAQNATLYLAVKAKSIAVLVTRCDGCGQIEVRSGSTLIQTLDLDSGTGSPVQHQHLAPVITFGTATATTITIRVVSSGKPVYIDGLAVSRV